MAICGLAERVASRPRTLTEAELNRALLARQLLLDRSRLSLTNALERIAGIQAQYAPAMYVGLWSRLEGFEREQLTRALERRTVVQGTSLRATIHLLTPRDWWVFSAATVERRRREWVRTRKLATPAQMDEAVARVRPLFDDGPVERKVLQETIGLGAPGISGINAWLDLVRVPPSGTWDRRRADLFADAADWIGPPPELEPAEATAELARSYLRGFGPGSAAEIADWAGLGLAEVRDGARTARAAPFPRRGRRGARRPAAPAAAGPADAGSGALPADLGRDAARPRSPRRRSSPSDIGRRCSARRRRSRSRPSS